LAEAERALADPAVANLHAEWEKTAISSITPPPSAALVAHRELEGSVAGMVNKATEYNGDSQADFEIANGFDTDKSFSLAVWVRRNSIPDMDVLHKTADANTRQGFELAFGEAIPIGDLRRGAQLSFRLTHRAPDDAIEIRTKEHYPQTSKEEGVPK